MKFHAKVLENRATEDEHVRILVLEEQKQFKFHPGQWVSVQQMLGDQKVVRAYSMLEPDGLVICLDAVENGLLSPFLCQIEPGSMLHISGPYGNFKIPEPSPKKIIMCARYTGIVPFHCMIRDLEKGPSFPEIHLIYEMPSQAPLFNSYFEKVAKQQPNFNYHPCPLPASPYSVSRLLMEHANKGDCFPMLAGINDFVKPLRTELKEAGFQRGTFSVEKFG